MTCCCCGKKTADGVPVPFLANGLFVCAECEKLAQEGRRDFGQVDFGKPWAKALERKYRLKKRA